MKSTTRSVIDSGVMITGTVACTGELEILGQVQGDLHCATLIVRQSGRIQGDVFAENAHIDGRIDGAIRGKQIVLGSSAHVMGDIHHASLVIEHGAIFEGKVRRSSNPTELQPMLRQPPQSPAAPQGAQRPAAVQYEERPAASEGDMARWPRQVPVSQ